MSLWFVKTDTRSWGSLFVADRAWIALLILSGIVCLLALVLQQVIVRDDTVAGSLPVEAEVISYMSVRSGDAFQKVASLAYQVEGRLYMTSIDVSNIYSVMNPVGQNTTIYYDTEKPYDALLRSSDTGPLRIPFGVVAGLAAISALWIGLWAGLRASGAINARQTGRPGSGRIDAIEVNRAIRVFGKELVPEKARLVFVDNFGRQSKTLLQRSAFLNQWSVGDELDIYVGPNRSWWEGDVGVRRAKPRTSAVPAAQPE